MAAFDQYKREVPNTRLRSLPCIFEKSIRDMLCRSVRRHDRKWAFLRFKYLE